MKAFWTFVVGVLGIAFTCASFYNLSKDSNELVFWVCLFLSISVIVGADRIVNMIYRRLGPKPMAVRVIGVPPKRFRKGF